LSDAISFQEAVEATKGEDRALLVGNGFSIDYFNYKTLLEEAGLEDGSPIKALFDGLDTVDFEAVIRAMEDAVIVERAYGNDEHASELEADAQAVREALVNAVNARGAGTTGRTDLFVFGAPNVVQSHDQEPQQGIPINCRRVPFQRRVLCIVQRLLFQKSRGQ